MHFRKVTVRNIQSCFRTVIGFQFFFFFFIFFFFYRPLVARAPGGTAAMKAYCVSPALKVPACTARRPHAYEARDL
jgi:hypothetical protein